jgi:CheY-like chemotaxis protein
MGIRTMSETRQIRHVLVVDDDALARMTALQCVKQTGWEGSAASGGVEALDMLRSERYDMVLLDIVMPVMDGVQVLAEMQQDAELSRIPVIVVSGTDEAESINKCIELGAAGHLSKPLDIQRLTECVETLPR